jgi:hypothetical protein
LLGNDTEGKSDEIKREINKDAGERMAMWRKAKWSLSVRSHPTICAYKNQILMQWSPYTDEVMKFFFKVRRGLALKELRYCCVAASSNLINWL